MFAKKENQFFINCGKSKSIKTYILQQLKFCLNNGNIT